MANKEVLASLEIINSEIRLIVGEFHSNRLNILKVERLATAGVRGVQIIDEFAVIETIQKAVANIHRLLGVQVESVLLIIPSFDMIKKSLRVNIIPEQQNRQVIAQQHFDEALRKLLTTPLGEDHEIVNCIVSRFYVDGVISRKVPLGEEAYSLAVDIDILGARKEVVYQYAALVEKAGLRLHDISLDNYAICKEASLFEQSINEYIILIRHEEDYATLSLITQGRLMTCEIEMGGIAKLIQAIVKKYKLPYDTAKRLLLNNCRYNSSKPQENPIYLWAEKEVTKSISEKEVIDETKELLEKQVADFRSLSHQILEQENVSLILTGEAISILGLKEMYENSFNIPVREYRPQTLGIRDSSLAAVTGNFYVYKDQVVLRAPRHNSVNILEFEKIMSGKRKSEEKEEDTLTNRFKGLFDRKNKQ